MNRTTTILLNIFISLTTLVFQLFLYGFSSFIPKDGYENKTAVYQAAKIINKILIPELIIGALLIAIINYSYLRKTTKNPIKNLLSLELIFIIAFGLSLVLFMFRFIIGATPH